MPYDTYFRRYVNTATYSITQISSRSWDEPQRPLPYIKAEVRAPGSVTKNQTDGLLAGGTPNTDVPWGSCYRMLETGRSTYALAYDRFYQRAAQKANLAITLAQRRQAMSMVTVRARQILKLAQDIYTGRILKKAFQQRRHWKPGDRFAANWLEYTFGWVPLVSDIAASVEVLQGQFPIDRVRGSAFAKLPLHIDQGASIYQMDGQFTASLSISADVYIDNSDLLLANALGFVNPALVVWDLVPFSFVVDWFLPVNKFLASYTNEVGIRIERPSTTRVAKGSGVAYHIGDNASRGPFSGLLVQREITPFVRPGFTDRIRMPEPSLWLAATSVALVYQQLRRFSR